MLDCHGSQTEAVPNSELQKLTDFAQSARRKCSMIKRKGDIENTSAGGLDTMTA
jgi:hypothetical protein